MASGSHYTVVHTGSGWSLGLWRCDATEPGAAHPAERTGEHQVVFPTRGVYARRIESRREMLDATRVVYFNAGEWYEVDHPVGGGDRCTVISLKPAVVAALASDGQGLHDAAGTGPRFTATSRLTNGRLHLAQHRLLMRVLRGGADPIAADGAAFDLVRASLPVRGHGGAGAGDGRMSRHHERAVDRALEMIHAEFRSPLTLDDIARAAAYSPYHLGRVFRARAGTTLHRYMNRLRLREALIEMADTRDSIGTIALRYGFSSHSHFTEAFRREFGTAPRTLRVGTRVRERPDRRGM